MVWQHDIPPNLICRQFGHEKLLVSDLEFDFCLDLCTRDSRLSLVHLFKECEL